MLLHICIPFFSFIFVVPNLAFNLVINVVFNLIFNHIPNLMPNLMPNFVLAVDLA